MNQDTATRDPDISLDTNLTQLTELSPSLYLSDLSHKDKPWDRHRASSDIISELYASVGDEKTAQKIKFCANFLAFQLTAGADLKLSLARFCRVRYCAVCQWRRSLMWKARAYKGLSEFMQKYPKRRWIFATFTVKNCQMIDLRNTANSMNKAFARMSQLARFPGKGWIKSLEVTAVYDCYRSSGEYVGRHGSKWIEEYEKEHKVKLVRQITDEVHPHFHVLMNVLPSYFSGANRHYLSHDKWIEMWQASARLNYPPSVNVKAIPSYAKNLEKMLPEILKYQTKVGDLCFDANWLYELSKQMKGFRSIAIGGDLKDYLRKCEDNDDLIHADDEPLDDQAAEQKLVEHLLTFGWKADLQKYRRI